MHSMKYDVAGEECGCIVGSTSTTSQPNEQSTEESKSARTPEDRVPPPAPIPPPPEEQPGPAVDMTEEVGPPSFGKKEDWSPSLSPNDADMPPAGNKLPPVNDAEPEKVRPEFDEPSEPTQKLQQPVSDELQPVNYELRTQRNPRLRTASRQITLSNSEKTSDKDAEGGQTPTETTTIPATSVTRKRIQ